MGKKITGKLFVFEGIDHVGKTTIVSKTIDKLKEYGISCSSYSFPGNEPQTLGALVYDIHHHSSSYFSEAINPISLQILHIAAHIESIYKYIIPDIQAGKIVLLDRSWWSTYVYGLASGIDKKILKKIISPEEIIIKKLQVSRYFLIKRGNIISDYTPERTKTILQAYGEISNDVNIANKLTIINNDHDIEHAVSTAFNLILNETQPCQQLSLFSIGNSSEKGSNEKSIYINKISLKTSPIYDAYWKFAYERQNVFFARLQGKSFPWTNNTILQKYKFTNAYRASDRVSQFLIKNIIYNNDNTYTPEDIIFRIILFKMFNRIDTWRKLEKHFGRISFNEYNYEEYDRVLTSMLLNKEKVYSAAYIMPSGESAFGFKKKHQNNLKLLEYMMSDNIAGKIGSARTLKELYEILLTYPTIGKFLAFQYAIDINYSELCDFDEMSFIVVGPGAHQGIQKCFRDYHKSSEEDIVNYMAASQEKEFDLHGLKFQTLWGRPLQLIDCQNLFCEIDKYSRVAYPNETINHGRTRIKQQFRPNFSEPISYFYPPKWGINALIER
jgi:thymidylate kinase